MQRLALIFAIALATSGCRWNSAQTYPQQPFGGQAIHQPGYEQTFPQQNSFPAAGQFGQNAGKVLGNVASGFFRSAVGGAGFTAGRDLWNEIVR